VNRNEITSLAKAFRAGKLPLNEFLDKVASAESGSAPKTARLAEASVDLDRARRCGYPEVIYAEGKSVESLCGIIDKLREAEQPVLATRVDAEKGKSLSGQYADGQYNGVARTFRLDAPAKRNDRKTHGTVAVISAGTSDLPVAEEARETLEWMGIETVVVHDVGVAGPHRLVERLPELAGVRAAIVVAGMEGALPSVVGGYVSIPVIAVPTSVGYGANFAGLAALLGMLNSCAANVTVVNIDAGFKAGYVAGLIASGER